MPDYVTHRNDTILK